MKQKITFEQIEKWTNQLVLVATILMIISYVPQLVIAWGTRNVEGQSLTFWALLVISLGILTLQQLVNYLKGCKINGFIFQALNFLLAFLMLVAVVIF